MVFPESFPSFLHLLPVARALLSNALREAQFQCLQAVDAEGSSKSDPLGLILLWKIIYRCVRAELTGQGWGSGHILTLVNMELGGVLFESELTLFSGARTFSSINTSGTCEMTDWKTVCPAFVFE